MPAQNPALGGEAIAYALHAARNGQSVHVSRISIRSAGEGLSAMKRSSPAHPARLSYMASMRTA